ncbi:hypothetical protein C8J57DRAFT_1726135 [Mycena rebaudengoi]|nr:hypothetical protein C8J57DRAFT_1726135 [Mycena rebaudengoi]
MLETSPDHENKKATCDAIAQAPTPVFSCLPFIQLHPNDAVEGNCEYPVHPVSDGALANPSLVRQRTRPPAHHAQACIRSDVRPGLWQHPTDAETVRPSAHTCLPDHCPWAPSPCLPLNHVRPLGIPPWTMHIPGIRSTLLLPYRRLHAVRPW